MRIFLQAMGPILWQEWSQYKVWPQTAQKFFLNFVPFCGQHYFNLC
jgi:hypothetical protein